MRNKKFHFDYDIALALMPLLYMILFALMIIFSFTSCATKSVVVPEIHERVIHQRDTVYHTDSVVSKNTTIIQQADSAMMAAFGIRLNKMEKAWLVKQSQTTNSNSTATFISHKDSIFHDSIPVPYPKIEYKDKELNAWQRIMMQLGYGFLGVILGAIVLALWKYKKK